MDVVGTILQFIISGGPSAIIVILVVIAGYLIWDRLKLMNTITETVQLVYDAKDKEAQSIKEIVDRYHTGNLNLVQALNEIKIVLTSIQIAHR